MAAEAELGGRPPLSLPPSLPPGPPHPREGGDSSRPYPCRGAGLEPRQEAGAQPLSCGSCEVRLGRAGPGEDPFLPRSSLGGGSVSGVVRREGRGRVAHMSTTRAGSLGPALAEAPGERRVSRSPYRRGCHPGAPQGRGRPGLAAPPGQLVVLLQALYLSDGSSIVMLAFGTPGKGTEEDGEPVSSQ
ncbi:uncharacterized protein PRD47_011596 [Ara ararauna]